MRRATHADAPAVQSVLATDPATWELLEGAPLRSDESLHLLAERPPGVTPDRKFVYVLDDLCVIDMVQGYPDPATWYLGVIFIAPGARNLGLGSRLIAQMAELARRGGGTALRLAVVAENTAARRLYDRLGFQLVARRPRNAQQVDVLELALSTAPTGFHVDAHCCTNCGTPQALAPHLFASLPDYASCCIVRQPRTDAELDLMCDVLAAQDLGCIRYFGEASEVLVKIRARGLGELGTQKIRTK